MEENKTPAKIRALILEDRPDDVELIVLELERAGLEIVWEHVDNEQDYLRQLNAGFDIIMADFSLPQFNAPRALSLLQQQGLDIPFIIVTGSISEEVAVECMKQGAADYLLKDRLSRLGPAVLTAFHEKQLRDAKRATEEALRQSEEKFKTIFNKSLDVIIIVQNETGQILDVNPAVQYALQYPPEQLVNRHFSLLFPAEVPQSALMILENLRTQKAVFVSQKFARANGSLCLMDLTATTIPWANTEVVLVTLRDATERERAEQEYQHAQLLRIQLEKERELNELKSRFISMVTHEFRTPLASIQLTTSILEGYLEKLDAEQRARRFKTINAQIEHMTSLLNDILTISRAEAGMMKFEPVEMDLDQLCHDIVEEFQIAHEEKHSIIYTVQSNCPSFMADEKLLRHVLTNLVSNAIKYSPNGGTVRVHLACGEDQAVLTVQDEGIGIPEKDQKRLFEPFHRGANVNSISGTGLGLAITKHAVELHGGTIVCESQINRGTTFTMTIPRRSPAETHS